MIRKHEKAFEQFPPSCLRPKYKNDPNPQYDHLVDVVGGRGGTVMDIGCASCIMYPLLKDKVEHYIGVDIIQKFLDHAKTLYPEIEVKQGSLLDIPFPDNSFDTVFCKSVLLHLDPKDVPQAIHEMMRVASKQTVIGFRVLPGKRETVTKSEEFFYVNFRKQDILDAIESHSKFKNLDILPGGWYRGSQTGIYLITLKNGI